MSKQLKIEHEQRRLNGTVSAKIVNEDKTWMKLVIDSVEGEKEVLVFFKKHAANWHNRIKKGDIIGVVTDYKKDDFNSKVEDGFSGYAYIVRSHGQPVIATPDEFAVNQETETEKAIKADTRAFEKMKEQIKNLPEKELKPVSSELAIQEFKPGLLAPIDSIVQNVREYDLFNNKILAPTDFDMIQGKQWKNKKAWRKYAKWYGIRCEIVSEKKIEITPERFVFEFIVRASYVKFPELYQDADGSCDSDEKEGKRKYHDTRSTALTRAKTRAISDLMGTGEVSAEEMR